MPVVRASATIERPSEVVRAGAAISITLASTAIELISIAITSVAAPTRTIDPEISRPASKVAGPTTLRGPEPEISPVPKSLTEFVPASLTKTTPANISAEALNEATFVILPFAFKVIVSLICNEDPVIPTAPEIAPETCNVLSKVAAPTILRTPEPEISPVPLNRILFVPVSLTNM